MRRSIVLEYSLIERLSKKPELENIIIGTGVLARDMREKLRLLGLKVPFLVGAKGDKENNILHYSEIAELGDPKRYRFIVCCDIDEWTLLAPAQSAAYKFLGSAAVNHPRMIRFGTDIALYDVAGTEVVDAVCGNLILNNGRPYAKYGDEGDGDVFNIHILGSCHAGGILRFTKESFPELLHRRLTDSGFDSAVYTWGQPRNPNSDSIMRFIRDICFHRADLIILYNAGILDPLCVAAKNALSTRADTPSRKHPFIRQLERAYKSDVSNGMDHDGGLLSIHEIQQRTFVALSRLFGFCFWTIVPPTLSLLSEEQARKMRGLSPGYYARQRKKKDELLSALDERHTKDYSDTFLEKEDINAMFADWGHLSDEGNSCIAERCVGDILKVFGRR